MDMNQISLASLMMDLNMRKSNEVREDLVRHMILNITGEETISLITKLVVKRVEKTIIKIGMQSSIV